MTDLSVLLYRSGMRNSEKLRVAKDAASRVIERWRDTVIGSRMENAKQWADRAGIDPTTVTRTMSAGHPSTAKIENLHLLARAARVPSVVDFLEEQIMFLGGARADAAPALPSALALEQMFRSMLETVEVEKDLDERARRLALSFPGAFRAALSAQDRGADDEESIVEAHPHVGA